VWGIHDKQLWKAIKENPLKILNPQLK
jgi:hypothetical protein